MSEKLTPFVLDADQGNFDALVLGNSMQGLVLVHFWSPKAGPCMVLMPRLVKLAAEYSGRFLLVMANTDVLGQRARALGVASVPTVKFFLRGEVVHTIHGAEPDSAFHAALGRFLAGEQDLGRMAALATHQAGRTAEAIEQLARIALDDPEDLAVATDLAKLLILAGRPQEALQLLSGLPEAARGSQAIAPLLAHLELIDAAQNGPEDAEQLLAQDPENADARLALAARALFNDAPEAALEHLLALARAAPEYRQNVGRRAMIALFGMLGSDHDLTRRYRPRLAVLNV